MLVDRFIEILNRNRPLFIYLTLMGVSMLLYFTFELFTAGYLFILLVFLLAMYGMHHRIKQNRVQWFTFTLTLVSGVYGFSVYAVEPYNLLNALYSTIRLFIIDLDNVFDKNGSDFIQLPFPIEIARWSAIVYVISTILSLIYQVTKESIRIKWISLIGNHYVICGLNHAAKYLAEDLLSKNRKVIIIDEDSQHPDMVLLREQGAVFIHGNPSNQEILQKAHVAKCSYLIALNEDDAENLNIFMQAKEAMLANQVNRLWENNPIVCIIHMHERQLEKVYEGIAEQIHAELGNDVNIELKLIDLIEASVRHFFDSYPLYEQKECNLRSKASDPLHLLIFGFGATGQQIALQALQRAHFFNRKKLHITVVDSDAEGKRQEFGRQYKGLSRVCEIQFISAKIEADDIPSKINWQQRPRVSHIFVCLENRKLELVNALRIQDDFKAAPIFIKVEEEMALAEWIHRDNHQFEQIIRFGSLKEYATEEIIINEELDQMAKFVHQEYIKNSSKEVNPWERITLFEKESNRSQAAHIDTKLYLMGLRKVKKCESNEKEGITRSLFDDIATKYIEDVAISEHSRWNTFHFLNGWKPPRILGNKAKNVLLKEHACLVEWEELDQVSSLYDSPYKDFDRDTVRNLYDLLMDQGYIIILEEREMDYDPVDSSKDHQNNYVMA